MKSISITPIDDEMFEIDIVCDCGASCLANADTGYRTFRHPVELKGQPCRVRCECGKEYLLKPLISHFQVETIKFSQDDSSTQSKEEKDREDLLNESITILKLPPRATGALIRAHITTIRQVMLKKNELAYKVRGFSKKSYCLLRESLQNLGFKLDNDWKIHNDRYDNETWEPDI